MYCVLLLVYTVRSTSNLSAVSTLRAEVTVWVVRTYIVEGGTELCFETVLEKCTIG